MTVPTVAAAPQQAHQQAQQQEQQQAQQAQQQETQPLDAQSPHSASSSPTPTTSRSKKKDAHTSPRHSSRHKHPHSKHRRAHETSSTSSTQATGSGSPSGKPSRKHTTAHPQKQTLSLDQALARKGGKAKRRGSAKTDAGPPANPTSRGRAGGKKMRRRHSDTVNGSTASPLVPPKQEQEAFFDWTAFDDSSSNLSLADASKGHQALQKEAQEQAQILLEQAMANSKGEHKPLGLHLQQDKHTTEKAERRDSGATKGTFLTAASARAATEALNLLHCQQTQQQVEPVEPGKDTTSALLSTHSNPPRSRTPPSQRPRHHRPHRSPSPTPTTTSDHIDRIEQRLRQRQRLKEQKRLIEQKRIQQLEEDVQKQQQEREQRDMMIHQQDTTKPKQPPQPNGPGAVIANLVNRRHLKDRKEHREHHNPDFRANKQTIETDSDSIVRTVFQGFKRKEEAIDHGDTQAKRSRLSMLLNPMSKQKEEQSTVTVTTAATPVTTQTAPAALPSQRRHSVRTTLILGGLYTPTATPTKQEATAATAPAPPKSPPRLFGGTRRASLSPPPSISRGQTGSETTSKSSIPITFLSRGTTAPSIMPHHRKHPAKKNRSPSPTPSLPVPAVTKSSPPRFLPMARRKARSPSPDSSTTTTNSTRRRRSKLRFFQKRHSLSAGSLGGKQKQQKRRFQDLWGNYSSRSLTDVTDYKKDDDDYDTADDNSVPSFLLPDKSDPPDKGASTQPRKALLDTFLEGKQKAAEEKVPSSSRVPDLISDEASLKKKHRQWRHLQHAKKEVQKEAAKQPTHPPTTASFDDSQATIITHNKNVDDEPSSPTLIQTGPQPSSPALSRPAPTKALRLALPKIRKHFPKAEKTRRPSQIQASVNVQEFKTDRFSINSERFSLTPQAYLQMVVDGFDDVASESNAAEKDLSRSSHNSGDIHRQNSLGAASCHSETFFDALEKMDDATYMSQSFHSLNPRISAASLETFSPDLAKQVQEDFFDQFEQLDSDEQDDLLQKIRSVSVLHPHQFQWTEPTAAGKEGASDSNEAPAELQQPHPETKPSHIDVLLSKAEAPDHAKASRWTSRRRSQSAKEIHSGTRDNASKCNSFDSLVSMDSAEMDPVAIGTPRELLSVSIDGKIPNPPQKHQQLRSFRGRGEDPFSNGLRKWERKGKEILDSPSRSGSISSEDEKNSLLSRRRSMSLTDIEQLLPKKVEGPDQGTGKGKSHGTDRRLPTLPSVDLPTHVNMQQNTRRVSSIVSEQMDLASSIISMSCHWRARHPCDAADGSSRTSTGEADEADSICDDDEKAFLFESFGSLPSQIFDRNRNLLPFKNELEKRAKPKDGKEPTAAPSRQATAPSRQEPPPPSGAKKPHDEPSEEEQSAPEECTKTEPSHAGALEFEAPRPLLGKSTASQEKQFEPEQENIQHEAFLPSFEGSTVAPNRPLEREPEDSASQPPVDTTLQEKAQPEAAKHLVDKITPASEELLEFENAQPEAMQPPMDNNSPEALLEPEPEKATSEALQPRVDKKPEPDRTQPEASQPTGDTITTPLEESLESEKAQPESVPPRIDKITTTPEQSLEPDTEAAQPTRQSEASISTSPEQQHHDLAPLGPNTDPQRSNKDQGQRGYFSNTSDYEVSDIARDKGGQPMRAGYFSQPSDYEASDVEEHHQRQKKTEAYDVDAAPTKERDYALGGFAPSESYRRDDFGGEDIYDDPRPRKHGRGKVDYKQAPRKSKARRSSSRYYEGAYNYDDEEDLLYYRETNQRRRSSRRPRPDPSFYSGRRRVSRRELERERRMSSRELAYQQPANRQGRRETRRPSRRDPYEYDYNYNRASTYTRGRELEEEVAGRHDYGGRDPYLDSRARNGREERKYRHSHVGRSVVIVKENVQEVDDGGSKSSLVNSKSSLEEGEANESYKEPLYLLKEDPPLGPKGEQRRRLSSTTSRLASSRSLLEGMSTTASLSDLESARKFTRKSELDKEFHGDGKARGRRKKRLDQLNAGDDDRPLYHRPNLEEERRQRRRRDFEIMGGVPSFYDDHLYASFDFIDLERSCYPKMTEDGEHDDNHMLCQLKYQQWEGMPRIRTDSSSEDDCADDFRMYHWR